MVSWDRREEPTRVLWSFSVGGRWAIFDCRRQRGRFLPGAREPGGELDPGNLDDPHWRGRAV